MEGVEGVGDHVDDLIEGVERLIAEAVGAGVFPDLFDGVALGAVGWERDEGHGVRDDEGVGLVPTGAVHEDDTVVVGELGGGVGEEQAHEVGIDPGEDEGGHAAVAGADRSEGVDELADHLLADTGA